MSIQEIETLKVKPELPGWAEFLFEPARFKVARGGRGGTKSWTFARALLIQSLYRPMRILCGRELQTSIGDSVHRLLSDQITLLGLDDYFQVFEKKITTVNGSLFIFQGLKHNITRIRSMEALDICWVEEAEKVSKKSWRTLIPTLRVKGSELWVSYNPDEEDDPTSILFLTDPPPDTVAVNVGWEDNPWISDELLADKDYLYRVDPDAADNVWGGNFVKRSDAQVLGGKWCVEAFEPGEDWNGPYYGADWGFSVDPACLMKIWIHDDCLYVQQEAWRVGVEIEDVPPFFDEVIGSRDHLIRADNARPELINYVRRHGFNIVAADKWPGSVKDGITFLRSFKQIIIHPACRHAAQEAKGWRYKVDPLTEDVLPVLVAGNEHTWDAVRYALQPLIKKQPSWRPI